MGFFNNLRAAGTTSMAATFVEQHLRAQAEAGRFHHDPRKVAEAMVLALWGAVPALASQQAKPKPVLVAAGALAKAIREAERLGDRATADVLHSALQMLWLADIRKLVDVERITGIDDSLFRLAGTVFEKGG